MAVVQQSQKKKGLANALAILSVEMLFTLLPFIVSGMIFTHKGEPSKLIYTAEWSLAASVLFGQTLVKLISSILSSNTKVQWERIALTIALLIVVGLVPSLLVMFFIITDSNPSFTMALIQICFFIMAFAVFFVLGVIAYAFENRG